MEDSDVLRAREEETTRRSEALAAEWKEQEDVRIAEMKAKAESKEEKKKAKKEKKKHKKHEEEVPEFLKPRKASEYENIREPEQPEVLRGPWQPKEEEKKKSCKWLWLLLALLLIGAVCGAGYYLYKHRSVGNAPEVAAPTASFRHIDAPKYTHFSYNTDLITYSEREITQNRDMVMETMTDYIVEYLAQNNYLSARVPMLERIRYYVDGRMGMLMGERFALQRFIPYEDDYIYRHCEPWLKRSYADTVRHFIQSELMNINVLGSILDNVVEELGIASSAPAKTAAEVQQVHEAERVATAPKQQAKPQPKPQEAKPAPAEANVAKGSKQGFDIIAGFYLNKGTATKMASRLHAQGCDAYIIQKNDMYYVSMGSAPTRTKAEALYNHIKSWYDGDIVIKQL
jgi:hypothetical protein